ncbi:sugar porter family MFS transporter [Sodalis endosymbiont of Spalangia cameroni]|uniref:sugar porter family MFS transporter n=1 Tax=Sodalis praecaptivus TaxID=1239307 RepID=UPI0031F86D7A
MNRIPPEGAAAFGVARSAPRPISVAIILSIMISAVGGIIYGYDTGIIGGAVAIIGNAFHLGSLMQGVVVSASLLGAMAGALTAGPLADRCGRKIILCLAGAIFAAGAAISAFSGNVAVLLTARILLGTGVGACLVLVPVYIAELAPAPIRGMLVASFKLLITLGILLAYGVNALAESGGAWRVPLGIAALFGAILACGALFITESPRWLISLHRRDEARRILITLRGTDKVEKELRATERLNEKERHDVTWRELWRGPVRHMVIIGALVAFLCNACGINLVIYFAPQILQSSGFDTASSWLGTLGLGATNVVFTLVGMLTVDRIGRRPLLIGGAIGLTLCMTLMASTLTFSPFIGSGWLALGALTGYIVMYALSPGVLCFLIISEIAPLRARAKVTSLSIFINFSANLMVALLSLPMLARLGAASTFWIFAAICAVFVWFSFHVPETRGKSLEDVEHAFRQRHRERQRQASANSAGSGLSLARRAQGAGDEAERKNRRWR